MMLANTNTLEEHNSKLIEEFIKTLPSLSERRILKYRVTFNKIGRTLGKQFESVTKDDLRNFISYINGSKFADWTKHDRTGNYDKQFATLP
jgi:uncharacterized protein YjgD (DUF1641 family)